MVRRNIIDIDESLCTGCGNCIIACAEGAIELVDGKAGVVSDKFCDGLGACIGECPVGALTIEEREADEFDEEAASRRLDLVTKNVVEGVQEPTKIAPCSAATFGDIQSHGPKLHMDRLGASSQLCSWPIQMRLAHIDAPYFNDAKLLIAADCTGFASASIPEFIEGRVVLIGCPKLDEVNDFVEKLTEILRANVIKEITVLYMEVPCCANLVRLVTEALRRSGKRVPVSQYVCEIGGSVMRREDGSMRLEDGSMRLEDGSMRREDEQR